MAELADAQHGVIARRQWLTAGISDDAIAHRVALRRLYRVHAGVVSVTRHLSEVGRFHAAVLACGDGALLSHRSAAALWDLIVDRGPTDVLIALRGQRAQPGLRVHTTRSIQPGDAATHEGIPCTSVPRTTVDLAAVLNEDELRRVVERSVTLRLFDARGFSDALERANGRRGTGRLRRLLAGLGEVPPTRSELERVFLQLVRDASLPSPVTNGLVCGHEVDFHWPDARLIVETDGRATHDNPFAFERDRQRDLELKPAGWEVIRITWR